MGPGQNHDVAIALTLIVLGVVLTPVLIWRDMRRND